MLNRLVTSLCALGLASSAAGCVIEDDGGVDSTLLVVNDSRFALTEIYLTDSSSDWGPNLLGGDVLLPGEDYLLGVDCGFYDALIVNDRGQECTQLDLDLCFNDADWVIRNNTCPVFE